jgi:thioredoxin 2
MAVSYTVCPNCNRVNKFQTNKQNPTCGACHGNLDYHEGVTQLSTEQVQKLIAKSPIPVVIDFWAPWCAPCRTFSPVFSETAVELAGQYVFVKLNTEEHPSAGLHFNIRGIPTIAVYQKGREVLRQSGAFPKDHFVSLLRGTSSSNSIAP